MIFNQKYSLDLLIVRFENTTTQKITETNSMHTRRRRITTIGILLVCSLPWLKLPHASAQAFPEKPVRIVVPFSAGGATDVITRLVGNAMSPLLGQTVVVENRSGAGGTIAAAAVSRSLADGYTILAGGVTNILVIPELDTTLPYTPEKDLEPIAQISTNDYVLVVAHTSPYQSVRDVVNAARQRPGQLSYATTGIGGPLHVSMEYLARENDLTFNHIPYPGESKMVPDLLSGRVDLAIVSLTLAEPMMKDGRMRILALLSERRSNLSPDIPTIGEAGYPGHEIPIWLGFFVPKGTPQAAIQTLSQTVNRAITQPEVRQSMLSQGAQPVSVSRTEFMQFITTQRQRWRTKIATTGIQRQ